MRRRKDSEVTERPIFGFDSSLWTTKYFPTSVDDLPLFRKNQRDAFTRLVHDALTGPPQYPRIAIITGSVGSGKSTIVKAVCRMNGIEVHQFSLDDELHRQCIDDDGNVVIDRSIYDRESRLVTAFRAFLQRAQLATEPGKQRVILVDDISLTRSEAAKFVDVVEDYGADRHRLFPLFWVSEASELLTKPRNCMVFNVPVPAPSMLKRVLKRVADGERLSLTQRQLDDIIASSPGDIRHVINQLQFAGCPLPGGYESLTFFQAVGEVLYVKNKRSAEDILTQSHCSPRLMMHTLYENALDFFADVTDYSAASDYISEADLFMSESWHQPDFGVLGATTVMRGIMTTNEHRVGNTFLSMRSSKRSRLRRTTVDPDQPFRCWPSRTLTVDDMDFALFNESAVTFTERGESRARRREVLVVTEAELAESTALMADDPIESDGD